MATHTTKKKTLGDLRQQLKDIEDEEIRFALEVLVEEKTKALRTIVLKRLEAVITLDDILQAFIDTKKVHDISVWAGRAR